MCRCTCNFIAWVQAQNEVAILALLDHPNVVKYHECFAEQGTKVKIVMELCEVRTQCPCAAGSMLLPFCNARASCQQLLQQKADTERQHRIPGAPVAWVEERSLEAQVLMVASALVQDGDLDKFIKARTGQLLPEDTIMLKFVQICLAVHYIHSKVSLLSCSCMNIGTSRMLASALTPRCTAHQVSMLQKHMACRIGCRGHIAGKLTSTHARFI